MRKDWDIRKKQIQKDKARELQGEYKLPLPLKILSIVTQLTVLGLCLNYIAGMFIDNSPVLTSYVANVVIDIGNGRDITVKDTFLLPQESEGATGVVRFIPDFTLDKRGEGSIPVSNQISATLDNKALQKLNPAEKVNGYLTFAQEDSDNPHYGHKLEFTYQLKNGARTQGAARYATVQLLNKSLGIGAESVDVLVYFPQKIDSPAQAAQLYVRSKDDPEVQLIAKGQPYERSNNIVEVKLSKFDLKKKDLFLKLTWSDFRDLNATETLSE